ncbi:TonB-linked SusC/RagA family outer membrane protein [Wenyingzhuangia heitensis]|uniref:TonB-linked SusC/RagA family outer membrane protein n=1 Tax=Wenyingzhuangia heitensis TaxID=1487859 RepID=A0ABX0UAP5_9FLAO|nr:MULTISPECIES: TonB-dependent receptor [Wenyingzhuangia]NIJ44531.1 TonB-linked SusC/RagA family outer membrane protein [Wenyingzhuangia heitensis]NJB83045.1 TonB-linked SusC/RagA family outer membrane protein [Wenyingzhuangia aestuarii]
MKFKLFDNLKTKSVLFVLLSVFSFSFMHAQSKKVSGNVSSIDGPAIGATVSVKSTGRLTVTDFDGNFEIDVKNNDVLVVDYMGYTKKEVPVKGKTIVKIELKQDAAQLEEVVVVGYGTQKKKEVTGAVANVKAEVIERTATADLGSAIQGQIAGVNVVATSGEPGEESNIQIRGVNSILGNNRPLYVVDGIPYEDDPKLSMNEIESIDVLKDGASAAIYGTRGAAGVILITTKKAREGQMNVRLNSYFGVQKITSSTPILDRNQRLFVEHLEGEALKGTRFGNTWTVIERSPHYLTNDTNLFDLIENDYATIQNHNLSISGGKNGLSYNVNGSFFSQEGVLWNSQYDRFNLRSNTSYKKGKWDIKSGISFRVEDNKISPWGLIQDAIKYSPLQPELVTDASVLENLGDDNEAQNVSYLGQKLNQKNDRVNHYFDVNINATYNISDNLKFTTRGAVSYNNGTQVTVNPEFIAIKDDGTKIQNTQSSVTNTSTLQTKKTIDGFLNYKKSIGSHNVNFTLAYSAEQYEYSQFLARKFDLFNNEITVLNNALQDEAYVESGTNQWTQDRRNTIIGSLARVQYNYKGKYLVNAFVRRDGSSRFRAEPYAIFPSVSLGWNVHDEYFWSPIKRYISQFKVRASRGTTGNNGAPDYAFAPVIQLSRDYVFGGDGGEVLYNGATQETFADPNLKWETSISQNLGVDMAFLSNKLTMNLDLYRTNKEDMLLPVLVPTSAGGGSADETVVRNVGDMTNQGIELAVNYRHKGKFSWNTGLTFTKNENEVTKMDESNPVIYFDDSTISGHSNDQDLTTLVREGYEAGAFFLHETNGVIQTQEQLLAYQQIDPNALMGDLIYVDENGDGKITIDDRTYAGSGVPEFEIGWNFNAYYKGFDMAMQWYGAFGGEILNGNKALAYKSQNHQDLLYQWSSFNTDSNIPVYRTATHNNYRGHTDYWLEDGSYLRLRNITVGYTIPKKKTQKMGVNKLRFYLAAQNLLTLTKYTGYDPEVGGNGLSTRGIDKGRYPVTGQVRAGIQLEF